MLLLVQFFSNQILVLILIFIYILDHMKRSWEPLWKEYRAGTLVLLLILDFCNLILILKNNPDLTSILILILVLDHMKRRWEALRIAYRAGISVLLLCVPPPTERHKQEDAVLGRLGEHKRMP